jgi:hypothetical protein
MKVTHITALIDFHQKLALACLGRRFYIFRNFASRLEVPKVISRILRLLEGINMAATIGVSAP